MKLVVDSCVVIAAFKTSEGRHAEAAAFFDRARARGDEIIAPITALWDIGAALDHPSKSPVGTLFRKTLELELAFIAVDEGMFRRTWRQDLKVPVKGPDRIFISCALDQKATLVSLDDALVANANAFGIRALKPAQL